MTHRSLHSEADYPMSHLHAHSAFGENPVVHVTAFFADCFR